MIASKRRGRAPRATAGDYQRLYETEVSGHLRAFSGFRGARLLRQDDGPEVMFTSITFFTSLDAIRGFAGDDFELAVVEETTRQALSRAGLISPGSCRPWNDRTQLAATSSRQTRRSPRMAVADVYKVLGLRTDLEMTTP